MPRKRSVKTPKLWRARAVAVAGDAEKIGDQLTAALNGLEEEGYQVAMSQIVGSYIVVTGRYAKPISNATVVLSGKSAPTGALMERLSEILAAESPQLVSPLAGSVLNACVGVIQREDEGSWKAKSASAVSEQLVRSNLSLEGLESLRVELASLRERHACEDGAECLHIKSLQLAMQALADHMSVASTTMLN
jgi:hypothetical protein